MTQDNGLRLPGVLYIYRNVPYFIGLFSFPWKIHLDA